MGEQGRDRSPDHQPGERVGLGRVVEDRLADHGTAEDDPGEASEDSFPASDPPTFMSEPATPATPDRDAIEAPAPDEVP